ncbi:MAG: SMP-30/gluconolactonase/LRE family protein [Paracoccus sp. (in: a-proteobacteria)]
MTPLSEFGRVVGTPASIVAESPIWDEATQRLYWVDIIGKAVFRHDPETARTERWQTEDFPTAIALCEGGPHDAVLALAGGVVFFDFGTGRTTPFCQPESVPGNRLNEGRCDPGGRLWLGSMQTNLNPDGSGREMDRNSGALFRVDGDGSISRHSEHEFGISNTMAWSPDLKTFYFGDSIRNVIFAYDYDADGGTLSNRRPLLQDYPRGVPDGSAIDADGCLWNARFGGACLIRITPKGKVDREISLPVSNPTSCTFGGTGRRRLYVCSATFTLDEAQLQANPLEGTMLSAEATVPGLSDHRFKPAQHLVNSHQ